MRKKLLSLIMGIIVLFATCHIPTSAEEIFYKNERGGTLTKKQYEYITKYISADELEMFNSEEFEYLMSHISKEDIHTDEKFVMSTEKCDGTLLNEKYISKKEMIDYFNGTSRAINSSWALSRDDTVNTNMKHIVMKMYQVAPSVKKVYVDCKWLSLPKTRSYDIIAVRTGQNAVIINSNDAKNVYGKQIYDGNVIDYDYTSNRVKIKGAGVGLSTNIVDSVSRSLEVKLDVTFGSGEDTLTVYGTYQHSVDDISLAKSQKYTFDYSGMGHVLKFTSNTVKKSYDDTPGLQVSGSINNY